MSEVNRIQKVYSRRIPKSSLALRIKKEPDEISPDLSSESIVKNELIEVEIDFRLKEEIEDFQETSSIHSDFQDNTCGMVPEMNPLRNDHSQNSPVPFGVKVTNETTKDASVLPKLKKAGLKIKTCENCGKMWYEGTLPIFKNILKIKKVKPLCNVCAHNKTRKWPFFCDVCNRGFHAKHNLHMHKKTHNDKRLFDCDICGKKLRSQNYIKLHKKNDYKCCR